MWDWNNDLIRKRALHKYIYIYFEPNESSQQLMRLSLHWYGRYATVSGGADVDHVMPPVANLKVWLRLSTEVSLIAAVVWTKRINSRSIKPGVGSTSRQNKMSRLKNMSSGMAWPLRLLGSSDFKGLSKVAR
jgi:hypothetical protein